MNSVFEWQAKVYYEDTDAGGVVYHANYLKYMERARSEWLASISCPVDFLEREYGIVFAVRHIDLDYVSPARLMDELTITTELLQLGKVKLSFKQTIYNGDKLIAKASIKIATLERNSFKLTPIPEPLWKKLNQ